MKNIAITIVSFLFIQTLNAQNPLVKKWDFTFGGSELDFITSFQQTTDGGYVLCGLSESPISGDKSSNTKGGYDYWILKMDALGNKQWDKDFGGMYDERLLALQQTSDGGYLLGGASSSDIDGDKTEANRDQVNFSHDFWIVKIDALGNKQWDKVFGGTEDDYLFSLQQTTDGGYILGGFSFSGIGGDKTQANHDPTHNTHDFWVVKVDSAGIMQWERSYGGAEDEQLTSVKQTPDGGYLLAGTSRSGIDGDKTKPSKGNYDYWILKIDSSGIKQWDQAYGGSESDLLYSIAPTFYGGFILGGVSKSGLSGDKSKPNWDNTNFTGDYWIIKIDDIGTKQWDKVYGGVKDEFIFGNISQTLDSGYLCSGISYSDISGNKTENNLGIEQSWIVKTDSSGNVHWDKTLFTNAEDECGYAIQSKDGCYVMTNSCPGDIGGYKSQSFQGLEDFWIVKFCDSTKFLTGLPSQATLIDHIAIYPNPFNDKISISFDDINIKFISCSIYNVLGQEVFKTEEEQIISPYTKTIDLSLLTKGKYCLVIDIDGKKRIARIVKE